MTSGVGAGVAVTVGGGVGVDGSWSAVASGSAKKLSTSWDISTRVRTAMLILRSRMMI